MEKNRLEDLKRYLSAEKYNFDPADFESSKSRLKLFVSKRNKEFVVIVIQAKNPVLEKNLLTEISVYRRLDQKNMKISPRLTFSSEQNFWLIREKIDAQITGNVYTFSKDLLTDNFGKELILGLEAFLGLNLGDLPILSGDELAARLERQVEKTPKHLPLVKGLTDCLKQKELISKTQKLQHFLHADLQPTNILIQAGKILFIDFESVRLGHPLFDFASLYHRAEDSPAWQKNFLSLYKNFLASQEINFDDKTFSLFLHYFCLLDVLTLDVIYLQKIGKPLNNTNLSEAEAMKLYQLNLKSVKNYLKQ